ncbi:MAG: LamG-like jellyroll fold domain-containing protein [Bacteroidia bacterium]
MKRILLLLLIVIGIIGRVNAQFGFDTYNVADGEINSTFHDVAANRMYVAGDFKAFGDSTSAGFAALNSATGALIRNSIPATNGQVNKIVSDGSTGFFIAGSFTQVGTLSRNYVAHILASGQVDANFNALIDTKLGGSAKSLAYSANGLVIIGNFNSVAGSTRNGIVMVTPSNGALKTHFAPNISGTINEVLYHNNLLFIAGSYSLLNSNGSSTGRTNFCAYSVGTNSSTLQVTSFNLSFQTGGVVYTMAISPGTNPTLYIGGNFTLTNNSALTKLVAINLTSGTVISSFLPAVNGFVYSLAIPFPNFILVGGSFSSAGGVSRSYFTVLSSGGQAYTSPAFNVNPNGGVGNITFATRGTNNCLVTISGAFTSINSTTDPATRWTACYDLTSTGGFTFNAAYTNGFSGAVSTSFLSGTRIIFGGDFLFAGGTRCPHLAVITNTGQILTNLTSAFLYKTSTSFSVKSIANIGNNIYLGGRFLSNSFGGRNNLLKISKTNGVIDLNFFQTAASLSNEVNVLKAEGNNLYVGGAFTTLGITSQNITKQRFAAINTSNNSVLASVNFSGPVTTIAIGSTHVFIGGSFSSIIASDYVTNLARLQKSNLSVAATAKLLLYSPSTYMNHSGVRDLSIINGDLFLGDGSYYYQYDQSTILMKAIYRANSVQASRVRSIIATNSNQFVTDINNGSSIKTLFTGTITPVNSTTYSMFPVSQAANLGNDFKLLSYTAANNKVLGTVYYSKGGNSGYKLVSFLASNPTAPAAPSSSASNLTFQPSINSINVNWANGNGMKRIVIAKKGGIPAIPTSIPNGIYASSSFGNGTNLGNGTYVIYEGSSNSCVLTNLTLNSVYGFRVIEFNENNWVKTFRLNPSLSGSTSTLDYTSPTTASNGLVLNWINTNSASFSWNNGNGTSRLFLIKRNSPITFTPVNGTSYFSNSTMSDGTIIVNSNASNTQVASNLTPGSTYYVRIVEYNGSGISARYLNSNTTNTIVQTTNFAATPTLPSSAINVTPSINTASINWVRGNGGRSIVLVSKVANSPSFGGSTINLINGTSYLPMPSLSSTIAAGFVNYNVSGMNFTSQVVYLGTGNSVSISSLQPNSIYQVAVCEVNGGGFNGSGQLAYLTNPRPVATFTTMPQIFAPSLIPTSHNVVASQEDANLNWAGGNGTHSLVVMKKEAPVSIIPTDNNIYTPQSSFGTGTQLGVGNYSVYSSTNQGFVNVQNLEPDVEYHFAIYEYNQNGAIVKYNSNPYRGIFRTSKSWPVKAGGSKKDAGGGVITDASGNVYVVGSFENSASWGTRTIVSNGGNDIFMTKYSPNGKVLWAVNQGGGDADAASSVAIDEAGDVIMTGSFRASGSFGTGNNLTSSGIDDIFISKLDAIGNVIWSKKAGGTDQDVALAITTDNLNNIYIAGYFKGILTFPGTSTSLTGAGGTDAFLAKYDSNGNLIWAKSAGGTGNDFAHGIAVNGANVAMVGQFDLTGNFSGTNLNSSGSSDAFIAEYGASTGNLNWVSKIGGTGADIGFAITPASNSYIITGQFSNSVTIGTSNFISAGNSDVFVCRYNLSGAPVWATKAGGVSQDAGRGITMNSLGSKAFVTGSFAETANFGSTNLSSFGNLDVFVATVDFTTGDFETVYQNGGPADDEARGITAGTANTSFITGYFNGQGSFGNVDLTSAGDWDIFVHKFTLIVGSNLQNGLVAWYKMNGNANDASGNGNNGNAQNLTSTTDRSNATNKAYLFNPNTTNVEVLAVNPIDVAGSATTNNSTYAVWLKTMPDFTNSNIPKPIFATAIDDGIEYRNISLSDIGTVNYSFFSNSAGIQIDQISAVPIQDNSWHHLAVVYKAGVEVIFYLDGIEFGRTSLTTFEPETFLGTNWNIGCLTNANRTSPIYSFNGSLDDMRIYRRALTSSEINEIKNQSVSNSLVENSDKSDKKQLDNISMYPNPSSGKVYLNLGKAAKNAEVSILDLSGKVLLTQNYSEVADGLIQFNASDLGSGVYIVRIEENGEVSTKKLIISK